MFTGDTQRAAARLFRRSREKNGLVSEVPEARWT